MLNLVMSFIKISHVVHFFKAYELIDIIQQTRDRLTEYVIMSAAGILAWPVTGWVTLQTNIFNYGKKFFSCFEYLMQSRILTLILVRHQLTVHTIN